MQSLIVINMASRNEDQATINTLATMATVPSRLCQGIRTYGILKSEKATNRRRISGCSNPDPPPTNYLVGVPYARNDGSQIQKIIMTLERVKGQGGRNKGRRSPGHLHSIAL